MSLRSPNQAFVATAIFTDYSTRNVTTSASWSSSNITVAAISNSGATIGRATGLAVGTSTITATYGGMSASTTLTVVSKKVTAIQVTPTNPTAVLGINQAFVATAVYDDSTTGAVTGAAYLDIFRSDGSYYRNCRRHCRGGHAGQGWPNHDHRRLSGRVRDHGAHSQQ